MKKICAIILAIVTSIIMLTGCGSASDSGDVELLITTEAETEATTEANEISKNVRELAEKVVDITEDVLLQEMDAKFAYDLVSEYLKMEQYKAVTDNDESVLTIIKCISNELSIYDSDEEEALKSCLETLKYALE